LFPQLATEAPVARGFLLPALMKSATTRPVVRRKAAGTCYLVLS